MKRSTRNTLIIAGPLLLAVIASLGWQPQAKPIPDIPTTAANPVPAAPANTTPASPVTTGKTELKLELPQEHFLMDPPMAVPAKPDSLKNLFKSPKKDSAIRMGGSLILDEKTQAPNAAVWDRVQGAEVEITIKTP